MENIIINTIDEINLKKKLLCSIEDMLRMLKKIEATGKKWSIQIRTLPNTDYSIGEAINQSALLPILIDYFENRRIEAEAYLMGMLVK